VPAVPCTRSWTEGGIVVFRGRAMHKQVCPGVFSSDCFWQDRRKRPKCVNFCFDLGSLAPECSHSWLKCWGKRTGGPQLSEYLRLKATWQVARRLSEAVARGRRHCSFGQDTGLVG